jgi:transposase
MGDGPDVDYHVRGLDVHKATISVAAVDNGRGGELRHIGVFANRPDQIAKLVKRLHKSDRRLSFCYEAGPCGYGLYGQLSALGHEWIVVAPSLIPMKAGDRVKTDRRDAVMLAKLHRAGELTSVWVPDDAHEAVRDLIRARATAVRVLGKARQQAVELCSGVKPLSWGHRAGQCFDFWEAPLGPRWSRISH